MTTYQRPFLKWAGGKYRSLAILTAHFSYGTRFVEPFLGSGVISLNANYEGYLANDINPDLMSMWTILQHYRFAFVSDCQRLFIPATNNQIEYTHLRTEFNATDDAYRKAILFVYLNRHCFNGICRYNKSGIFNVPFGKYAVPKFPIKEFEYALNRISKFTFESLDFRELFTQVRHGDVVYCDPPYLPLSQTANFNKYSAGGFSHQDHRDLADCAQKASNQGARVFVSNHATSEALELYQQYNTTISTFPVARTISSNPHNRFPVHELLVQFSSQR